MTIQRDSRHLFEVSPETYWRELCLSLEYQERLYCEALKCTRMEVLEHTGNYEEGMKRKLRFTKPIDAPMAITKLYGSAVTVEEHSEFDPKAGRWSYRIVPAVMGDRLDIRGNIGLRPIATGIEQFSSTSVTCRIFGLGTIIEHFVMKSTDEGSADKNRFTLNYIKEKGLR